MSIGLRFQRASRRGASQGVWIVTLAVLATAACGDPAPRRDPPVGVSPPPAISANVDTFPAGRGLPPAPPESLLIASAGRAGSRSRTAPRSKRAPRATTNSNNRNTDVTDSTPRVSGRRACLVESVHDGDTLRCRQLGSVRLLLIDAPETDQRPFGGRSQRQLAALAPPGTSVTLETDRQARDRYGRLLAYVYTADGRLANEEMVRAGYAVVLIYPPNDRYVDRIQAAASEAQAAHRGLFAEGGFTCLPREHRRGRC